YRPPPIFVKGEKANATIGVLRSNNLDQEAFTITMSKGLHSVQAKNQTTFETIKIVLIKNNYQFYTFTPRGEKLKSLLLKGMSEDTTPEIVLEDLKAKNIPSVEFKKVSELKFKRDGEERRHLIVQITQTSSLKELFKIKHVCYLKARWERLRRSRILQCRKCQRLGHTAANCQMEYRCVKCGSSSHAPAQCPLKDQTTRENFKCANCGKAGHPANYAGCTFLKFEKTLRKETSAQKSISLKKRIDTMYRDANPQISYANSIDEGILKYLNSRIKKLQKNKTESIKLLHMLSKSTNPHKQVAITKLKSTINLIKAELRIEFNKAVEEYWRGQIKQINHKDPTAFFPKINKLLRKKNLISIADQKINNDDPACLNGSIDISKATPVDNELIITDPTDKLNVIGDFYQSINAPRYLNTGTRLKEIVDSKASAAKELLKTRRDVSITITNFSIWKSAKVLPILKKNKDPSKATSYRPISLTSNIGKVYEMTINNHMVRSYKILEGLQQGTVNSPLLFNIYTMALLQSFGLNKESNHLSKKALSQIDEFKIVTPSPNTGEPTEIPHKKIVKYLGVHIDQLLRIRNHPDIQLTKAKAAFKANNRIFYNKNLTKRNDTGALPPQAFLPLDDAGLIQDEHNVPTIYHWKRHKAHKRIDYAVDDPILKWFNFSYSRALPTRDK
ncbi:GSCOCG00005314001-RA-CDS, partial [Cotesia congregata]